MKRILLISLFFALSLNITNWLDLAEEIKNNELNKTIQIEKIIETENNNNTIEKQNVIDTINLNSAEVITDKAIVTTEELPETGPEEFILVFLTLFLTSSIFIRNKLKK